MTKEVLDIELAGIDPNRPGSEGVTEAVGVDLSNPSSQAVTGEHDVHVMIAKRPGRLRSGRGGLRSSPDSPLDRPEARPTLPRLSPSSAAYVPCLEGRGHGPRRRGHRKAQSRRARLSARRYLGGRGSSPSCESPRRSWGLQAASKVVRSSFEKGWTTFCSRRTIGTRMNGFSST